MNNKGTYDTTGQEADLKRNSPLNVERTPTESGSFDLIGGRAPLKMTPGNSTPDRPVQGGSIQTFGEKADLSRDAHRGWSGQDTPMSDRNGKQAGNG